MARPPNSVYEGKHGDLLREINERYDYAFANWDPIRQEGAKDTRYVTGNPWEDDERNARLAAGRPVLASDELSQYENPLVNSVRENRRSVKFTPTGNGANDKTAELYQNKFRETEARSRGQIAFTTAFQNTVERSYGWARLSWRYASPLSMRRELVIDAIPNPDMVTPDPDFQTTTASDMRYCFVEEQRSYEEFKREFPKAEVTDFGSYTQAHSKWIGMNRIKLAEYWCVEQTAAKLLRLLMPDRQMKDVLEAEATKLIAEVSGIQVLKERDTSIPKVTQHLTNGLEILKSTPWVGQAIPLAACLGKIVWLTPAEANMGVSGRTAGQVSGPQRTIMSMTRLARDPYMLLCYIRSCQAEIVGMTPKVPYFVRRGSLLPKELKALADSLQVPRTVIEVETEVDGKPVEFPVRLVFDPAIQALEMLYESVRRSIQAAMAQSFLPTDAQKQNQKSGIALDKITAAAQKGSYHFIDHYEDFQIRIGELYQDCFDKVYDDEDDLAIILPDGTNKTVRVNGQDADGQPALSTKGDHAVTISTGPSFDSEREAANDFADTLVGNINVIAQVAGPQVAAEILSLSIKLKDLGVLGDQMAELISPKPLAEGEQPTPEQIQVTLKKMQGMVQQLQQQNQQLQQAQAVDQVKEQAQTERASLAERNKFEIAKLEIESKIELQRMKAEADLILQQAKDQHEVALEAAKAAQENANREDEQHHEVAVAAADAHHEELMTHRAESHDVGVSAAEAAHAAEVAEAQHARALEQGERAHEQNLEAGAEGHAQNLEAQETAAELAPKPEAE